MRTHKLFSTTILFCLLALSAALFTGCRKSDQVVIYTTEGDTRLEFMNQRVHEEFPDYDIRVEYMPTGTLAAKILTEQTDTEADIIVDMGYSHLLKMEDAGLLADLSQYDRSAYMEDTLVSDYFMPCFRYGTAVVVNTKVLEERSLPKPTCYEDLLDPVYKGLISVPSPKMSGTGYVFLRALTNAWGEEEAFDYFDRLTPNVLQYAPSGSTCLNALIQEEVAIGFTLTSHSAQEITNGRPLEILFFEEGSPYETTGRAIVSGKETEPHVSEVFDFLTGPFSVEYCEKFWPEKMYKDLDFTLENLPQDIPYADMSNDTTEERERLLNLWAY